MTRSGKAVFNRRPGMAPAILELTRVVVAGNAGKALALAAGLVLAPHTWARTVATSGNVAYYNGTSIIAVAPGSQGSPWSTPGRLYVGYTSAGTLAIENGGSVSTNGGTIGDFGAGTNTVTVDGSGSSWANLGTLNVGYRANGTLTIQNGGSVSSGSMFLGYFSGPVATLNLDTGGVLQTRFIATRDRSTAIHFNGGILQATGTQGNFLQNFLARSVTIGSGGAFIDTQAYNVGITTAGLFTGTGGLTKQGSGTLTIAGGNTWSGSTTVSAGTLKLGSYTQNSSQTLGIGAAGTSNYGRLDVTGTATFNADANLSIDVASVNSLANGQTLTGVVSAGTLHASTFSVTDNSALFAFTPVINGNTVDLNVAANRNAGVFNAVDGYGLRPAEGAARVLDTQVSGSPTGDMANVVTALGQLPDQASVARAAAQTLPADSGNQTILGTLSSIHHIVSDRLAPGGTGISTGDAVASKHVWIKPFGSHAAQNDENGASGFSANTWGLAVGAEGDWDTTRLGLAYAYANTRVDGNTALSGTGANAQVDSNVLALYGSRPIDGLMLDFQADTGWNDNSSQRGLNFGSLNRTASGSYGTWSAHVGTGLSKALPLSHDMAFIPEFRVDYTRLQSQSYSESGAGALDLNVNADTVQSLVLGADARLVSKIGEHGKLSADLGVGYDTINDPGDIVAAYAGAPGQSFTATGLQHSPWLMMAGLGYDYRTERGTDIALRYDVQGRTGFLNQSASLDVSWVF